MHFFLCLISHQKQLWLINYFSMIEAVYHGHSFIELVTEQGSILIDPFITGNKLCDITVEDCLAKNLIAICLTHGHSDHVWDTIELSTQSWCSVIAMVELCAWLQSKWVATTIDMNIWWVYKWSWRSVAFTRADHSSSNPDGGYAWLAAWLILTIGNYSIYHAGDTWLFAEMSSLTKYHLNLAFLPIWDRYTMGVDDAVIACSYIAPKIVVPIHYDTFPHIKADPQDFARQIMLENYAVPKVLKSWQAVILWV